MGAGRVWSGAPWSPFGCALPSWVRRCLERHGLELREPYQQGPWTGRAGPSSQDILVADLPAIS